MALPYCLFIRILKFSIDKFTYPYFSSKLSKYEGEELKRKCQKCSRGLFKTIYFGFMFIFGWRMVLNDTPFCPPIMLGEGELMQVFSDWPYTTMPKYLKFYYVMSVSYYLEDVCLHIVRPPNSDYFEMILHHIVAMMLIFASYINGFWNIGIFVLMQMDIADVFVGIIRVVIDFAPSIALFLIYLGIMGSWFYFRFIAYVYCVLWKFGLGGRLSVDGSTRVVPIIDFLLISLLGLNIYWFILLFQMGCRLVFKNKRHDLQQVVTQKDVQ